MKHVIANHSNATFFTSGIVRLECLVGALKQADKELADKYRQLLSATISLPLTNEVCERAAEFRAVHGLLVPDALHLAIAESGCDELWTSDAHFKRVMSTNEIKIRLID